MLGTCRDVLKACCRTEVEFNLCVCTGCPKSFCTDSVDYFTVRTFTPVQFLLAAVGNSVVTIYLVSISCFASSPASSVNGWP